MKNQLQYITYKLKIIKYNKFNKKLVKSEENKYIIFQSFFMFYWNRNY